MLTLLDRPEIDGLCLVRRVQWSPDGRHMAAILYQRVAGEPGSTVLLWDLSQSTVPRVLGTFPVRLKGLTFADHGRWIATGIDCRTVRVWKVEDPATHINLDMPMEPKRNSPLARLEATKIPWIASGSTDSILVGYRSDRWYKWDMSVPDAPPQVGPSQPFLLRSCAMSKDGRWLVFIHAEVDVLCMDATKPFSRPRTLATMRPVPTHQNPRDDWRPCERVSVSGCGKRYAFICGAEVRIGAVEGRNRKVVNLKGHKGFVYVTAFSPDQRTILTGGDDGTTRLWNIDRQEELAQYEWGIGRVTAMDVSPDGSSVIVGGDGERNLAMWDLE